MKDFFQAIFVENWRPKLMSLVVAAAVWYLIKKNITAADTHPEEVPAQTQR